MKLSEQFTGKKQPGYLLVFLLIVVVRFLFVLFYPLNSFQFFSTDSHEYVELANRALSGNFNFDIGRFIRSPLYPFFIVLHKMMFTNYWEQALITSQIFLSGLTGIFICRISKELFSNRKVEFLTGVLYAFYLPVFYYVYSFTSETLYLFFNVLSMFCFIKLLKDNRRKHIIYYAICFSLAYLTRSEIMLFMPAAILLIFYFYKDHFAVALKIIAGIAIIWFTITLPWGIVNEKIHHTYLTSSNGGKYVFYLANSPLGYADIVTTPEMGTLEYNALLNDYNFYNHDYDSIMKLDQATKQKAFFNSSLQWINDNPDKFIKAKLCNLLSFILPGLTMHHHSFNTWVLMFLLTLPIHLLFYLGLIRAIVSFSVNPHLWFICFYLCMGGFLTFFLYSSRFRAYGLEVYYLVYAAFAVIYLIEKEQFMKASAKP